MDTIVIVFIGILLLVVIIELVAILKSKKERSNADYYEGEMRRSMNSQDGTKGRSAFYSDMMGKKAN